MTVDATFARIAAIVGVDSEHTFEEGVAVFFEHLRQNLALPLKVKGAEDFRWEEFYVIGPGDRQEYTRLRKSQPSYQDQYDLLKIELGPIYSEWMLFDGDIAAHVRRLSDRKQFILGLAELKSVGKQSPSGRLLHDYAVYFVNNR